MAVTFSTNEPDNGLNTLLAADISIIGFVKRNSPEWDYMWLELSKDEMNKDNKDPITCENYGERWQYMDTSNYDGQIKHCFRHRMHPKMNDSMQYIKITASLNFNTETDCE